MHLTLITPTSPSPSGCLSESERWALTSVLWGWLSLAAGQTRSALQGDPRGAILDRAVASIDQGAWLQDVAVLPPMVLSAVRAAAMLAHLPDHPRQLRRWLVLNRECLYKRPEVNFCREILRLNATLEGVSGFEDDVETLQSLSLALIRFQWDRDKPPACPTP